MFLSQKIHLANIGVKPFMTCHFLCDISTSSFRFELSLNRHDILRGGGVPLSSLGVVGGDLVHLVTGPELRSEKAT